MFGAMKEKNPATSTKYKLANNLRGDEKEKLEWRYFVSSNYPNLKNKIGSPDVTTWVNSVFNIKSN